jgi:DNA repair protein RecN (Recombination protein N)
MLRRLSIENYGLIPRADVAFADGATMFTGETGSGKTMLLGALGFALGDRASADAVRRGASRATVTLAFEAGDELRARFEADGFPVDEGEESTIVRDVTDAGKSAVRLNGRPATAGYLREIAASLADVVGQHEAQRLLAAVYHAELLDRFAGDSVTAARARVAAAHAELQGVLRRLDALEGDDRRARERCDEARYAADEIEAARIELGEDERLLLRRRLLENVERVADALREAHGALADDLGASSALGVASVALHGIADVGTDLRELGERAALIQGEINELAGDAARRLEDTEYDPGELDAINARAEALDRLKRKYGGTLEAVLEHADAARTIVADFEGRDEKLVELRARRDEARKALASAAAALTTLRKKAATALAKRVAAELRDLALGSATFDVRFEPLPEIGADGAERAEFAFAANAGEPLRPLARVASGGELSRVLLALVVALAERRERSALVFDEIDAGIGGATATAVGERLGRLAHAAQTVCVTHLAQIAGWADRHYVLEKSETKGATVISIREIATQAERENELARMLSGETHDVAIEHARVLLAERGCSGADIS